MNLGVLGVYRRIILKKELDVTGMKLSDLEYYLVASFCENGNGLSNFMKSEEFHQLCDCQHVKKEPTSWSQLLVSCTMILHEQAKL
jgi:hypothetical protein